MGFDERLSTSAKKLLARGTPPNSPTAYAAGLILVVVGFMFMAVAFFEAVSTKTVDGSMLYSSALIVTSGGFVMHTNLLGRAVVLARK